jgi:signal peptidase II
MSTPSGSRVRQVLFLLGLATLVGGLVGCDHATKRLAANELAGRPAVTIIDGAVSLRYVENRDSAFGLLHRLEPTTRRALLVGASVLAAGLIVALWWQRRRGGWLIHLAFALVLAGAFGNLVDRALRGYVVDFVHVRFWPVFNAADAYLVVGIGLLLLLRRRGVAPGRRLTVPE